MKKILNKEVKMYLVFGIMTTIINYSVFAIGIHYWGENHALEVNLIAFILATIFAFVTNKKYVFENNVNGIQKTALAFLQFVASRVFSMLIEQAGLYISIHWLNVSRFEVLSINGIMIAKIILSFVAVVINYFMSKWFIFRKEKK